MTCWARCFYIDGLAELSSRVVPFEEISFEMASISYKGKNYNVPLYKIQEIERPMFIYGDSVSPVNHPDIVGIIADIIYHGGKNAPMFFIEINGKKKSKRYFEDDLIRG